MVATKPLLLSVVFSITLTSSTAVAGPTGPVAGQRCNPKKRPVAVAGTRCKKYLVYKDSIWTEQTCPVGYLFNPWSLYDRTPKGFITKVMLEEKVFKTWHHGRTVLIGDACHKFKLTGGQIAAMQDALTLANRIYTLPINS